MSPSTSRGGARGLFDMHVHTRFSPDSESELDAVCRRAEDMGVAGLCFTDHAEFAPGDVVPDPGTMEQLIREVGALKRHYRDRLWIGLGIEIGYYRGAAGDIAAFLGSYPFDFVLGSVHVCGDTCYSFPRSFESGADPLDYFTPYLEDMRSMAAEVDFDAVGHFDLPKRFGPARDAGRGLSARSPLWGQVRALLEDLLRRGRLLEINASGLRQNADALYPSAEILEAYRELGGRAVTLGSDSHQPSHMAWGIGRAARAARDGGIHCGAYFSGRKPQYYRL